MLTSENRMPQAASPNSGLVPWLAMLGLSFYLWVKFPRLMIIAAALSVGFVVLIFLINLSAHLQ
jgi:hypothetical protein